MYTSPSNIGHISRQTNHHHRRLGEFEGSSMEVLNVTNLSAPEYEAPPTYEESVKIDIL